MNGNSKNAAEYPPKSRWKRWLQNLLLFSATFLICAVLLELGLRIAGYGHLEVYEPDPKLYWKLKPNQDCYTKINRKPVHINSHGTRGPDFQTEKPEGVIRILSLGDSRTFGWGLLDEETYSRLLEKSVQKYMGTRQRIEVINAGVNAWSYPQIMDYFRENVLKYKPDFVLQGGANLWTQNYENNSP
jgi:hypothetical protein